MPDQELTVSSIVDKVARYATICDRDHIHILHASTLYIAHCMNLYVHVHVHVGCVTENSVETTWLVARVYGTGPIYLYDLHMKYEGPYTYVRGKVELS